MFPTILKKLLSKPHYLPFAVLFFGVVLRLFFVNYASVAPIYDEVIVTEISKQPIPEMLETIQAEPHPPGFYLVLKLLPVKSTRSARTAVIIANFVLTGAALLYAQKNKVLSKYKLSPGISLLFGSYTFLSISTTLKQDIISVPVFLFFLINLICLFDSDKTQSRTHWLLVHLSLICLLLLGYTLYAQALPALITATLYLKPRNSHLLALFAQLIFLVLFLKTWALEQIINNLGRFSWVSENNNSMLQTFSQHLTGFYPTSFVPEIIILVSFGLIGVFIYKIITRQLTDKFYIVTISAAMILIIAAYISSSFVRVRFVFSLFMLVSICMGWALRELKEKKAQLAICIFYFCFGIIGLFSTQISTTKYIHNTVSVLKKTAASAVYGVIDNNGGLFALTLKTKYELKNIVPINLFNPGLYEDNATINFAVLAEEGKTQPLNEAMVKELLSRNTPMNYMYIMEDKQKVAYFDGDRMVLRALQTNCVGGLIEKTSNSLIFTFTDCSF